MPEPEPIPFHASGPLPPPDAYDWPTGDGYHTYDDHRWPFNDFENVVLTPVLFRDKMGWTQAQEQDGHPDSPGEIVDEYGRLELITTAPTRAAYNWWHPDGGYFKQLDGIDGTYHLCGFALDDDGYVDPVVVTEQNMESKHSDGFFFVDERYGGCLYGLVAIEQPPWSWYVWNSVRALGDPF